MPAPTFQARTEIQAQWFRSPMGKAVLESEQTVVSDAIAAHPVIGLPWLWIAPAAPLPPVEGRGVRLVCAGEGWSGSLRCRPPLPIASESLGSVVLQHVAHADDAAAIALVEDCVRMLVPGGKLFLLGLNPLSPYRLRWRGAGFPAIDPATWRRWFSDSGLWPEPVAQGVGPQWSPLASPSLQSGPGLRAAYLQRAEKRVVPITPIRARKPLMLVDGAQAA
ncbi:MAG: hypothetical protein E6Q88_09115 [Lysobacteraceae bacterium]|nr:MAG: hypothetical protein E6Q88_09115 [Xanthomonadaceae bacterium]